MIIGRQLIERMYSDYNEYEDEKLYSTGDSELDDLLERAFCEGYEYAQREYSLKNNLKAIPRHIKRDIENTKIGIKMAAGKDLTNREVGKYAAAAKTNIKRMAAGKDKLKSKLINLESKQRGVSMDEAKKGAEQCAKAYKEGKKGKASWIPGYYNFVDED